MRIARSQFAISQFAIWPTKNGHATKFGDQSDLFHENVSIETTTFENHVGNQPIFLCCKPGEPVDLGINCDLEFDQTFRPGLF